MAKNYKDYSYFENRADVVKIFDDLDAFRNHCRFEMLEFNEANLYNRDNHSWRSYERSTRPKKAWTGEKKPWNGERKPYQGKNPRFNQ
jgi:hypothetical protein